MMLCDVVILGFCLLSPDFATATIERGHMFTATIPGNGYELTVFQGDFWVEPNRARANKVCDADGCLWYHLHCTKADALRCSYHVASESTQHYRNLIITTKDETAMQAAVALVGVVLGRHIDKPIELSKLNQRSASPSPP